MMRADSEPSGEAQSMADPVEMLVRVGDTRRTAPTPSAAATAATSAWRRVRTCFAKAMRPVSAATVWPESAECEEFVSEQGDGETNSDVERGCRVARHGGSDQPDDGHWRHGARGDGRPQTAAHDSRPPARSNGCRRRSGAG